MEADGELLLIRFKPDKDGKFGFNVKVSVFCYLYMCNDHACFADCVSPYVLSNGCLFILGRCGSEDAFGDLSCKS